MITCFRYAIANLHSFVLRRSERAQLKADGNATNGPIVLKQLQLSDDKQGKSMDANVKLSETEVLKEAISQFNTLAKSLTGVTGVNLRIPQALDELETAWQKIPTGTVFGEALDEARTKLIDAVTSLRKERSQLFGRIEADFIRAARESGTPTREQNEGWRIGKLEFQFRRATAMARILYNREEIAGWKPIAELEDLTKLQNAALKTLSSAELPPEILGTAFWNAYKSERDRRSAEGKTNSGLVPLPEFYRELRSAIVRLELDGQKPDRRLQYTDMPRWKFLYNLDQYRAQGILKTPDRRLNFQTGSQQDVQRGMGCTINGLDASQDYKVVCYVTEV